MSFWKRKKKVPDTPLREMAVPPGCEDPLAIEVLRAWLVGQRLHTVMRPTAWTSQGWGGGAVDLLRHVADAYEQQGGETAHAEMLSAMRAQFEAHQGGVGDPSYVTVEADGRGPLPHPPAAEGTDDQVEILRIWIAGEDTRMSLRYSCLGSWQPWGMIASDLLAHVAHAIGRSGANSSEFRAEAGHWFGEAWNLDDPSREGDVYSGRREDGWQLYFSQLGTEGLNASVRFDASLGSIAPDAHLSWRADVTATVNAPNDRGWPDGDEIEQIHVVEEAVQAAAEAAEGLNAVVVTTGGRVTWTAYFPDGDAARTALSAVVAEHSSHEVSIDVVSDPDWERFQTLWPNEIEWGFIRDMGALRELAAAGDDGRADRRVSHVARVGKAESADEYAECLRGYGFEAIDIHTDGEHEHAEPAFPVVVEFNGVHAPIVMLQLGERLRADAARCGGEYFAWGCEPVVSGDGDGDGEGQGVADD